MAVHHCGIRPGVAGVGVVLSQALYLVTCHHSIYPFWSPHRKLSTSKRIPFATRVTEQTLYVSFPEPVQTSVVEPVLGELLDKQFLL